ncbi:PKD domain-containing protein [Halorubrum californiense]|nr:PKD domain-containing protein [Halorubrum californiense]
MKSAAVATSIPLTAKSVAGATDSDWPMVQYDSKNSGKSNSVTGPTELPEEQWKIGTKNSSGNPCIYNGNLFINGTLYDSQSGMAQWSSTESIFAAVSGDVAVLTGGFEGIRGVDLTTGEQMWELSGSPINEELGIPTIHDGNVYVTERIVDDSATPPSNSNLYKIDKDNGELLSSLSEDGGSGYYGAIGCDGSHIFVLYGLSTASGVFLRKINTELDSDSIEEFELSGDQRQYAEVPTIPTVTDDFVYVGDYVYESESKRIVAIDKVSMTSNWTVPTALDIGDSVAAGNNNIFIPAGSGIYAFDKNSDSEVWSKSLDSKAYTPVIAGEVVYVGDDSGKIYAFDVETGEQFWEYDAGSPIDRPLAISDGEIYAPTSDSTLLNVTESPNDQPTAVFSNTPVSPTVDQEVVFDASESSDDNGVESYEWEFPNGESKNGREATYTFTSPGSYNVALTVTDVGGLSDSTNQSIDVSRPAEVPEAQFSYVPEEPRRGESVTFDASGSSSPDSTITEYEWTINDQQQYGEEVTYTFEESGEYSVSLEVTDDTDLSDSTQEFIAIANEQLSASMRGDRTDVAVGDEAFIELSLVNFLTNEPITVQLILQLPSGVSMTGVSGADEGSGQTTAVTDVAPGSETNILVQLQVNEPGELPVNGRIIYTTRDGTEGDQQLREVIISAEDSESPESSDDSTDSQSNDESGTDSSSSSSSDSTSQQTSEQSDDGDNSSDSAPGFGVGEAVVGLTSGYFALDKLVDRTQSEDSSDESNST